MTDIPFYWLDIFTESKFKGNPAAVCILEDDLDDETYQNIASELDLSETAFPINTGPSEYSMRYFTPFKEQFLCGHATMGTAYTLVHEYGEKSPIKFHTISGEIKVEVNENKVTLNFPIWTMSKTDNKEVAETLGVKDYEEMYVGDTVPYIMIVLKNKKQVEQVDPDFRAFKEYCVSNNLGGGGVAAKGDGEYDYVLRAFGSAMGVDEDPGTGIAQCLIAPYWGKKLGLKVLRVGQLSERGSEMTVELLEDGIRITGSATPLIKGILTI